MIPSGSASARTEREQVGPRKLSSLRSPAGSDADGHRVDHVAVDD